MEAKHETAGFELDAGSKQWVEAVAQQVKSLRYGVVQVVVHDARVVQIEKTERFRFGKTEV